MRLRRVPAISLLCLFLAILPGAHLGSHPAQQNGPQPLAYGQTVSGKLTTRQPEALYIFAAQQGDAITVTMEAEGNLDPLVILVDQSQQTVIAVGNAAGGSQSARLRFVIPDSANYIIRATAVQGSGDINGSYKLTLTLGNPTPTPSPHANAPLIAPLEPGEAITGDLSDAVRFHLYSLRARQGEPITARLELTGNLQAGLYLYTADFREVARAELGEALNAHAPADGLYFLMVARAASSGAGTFTLYQGSDSATTSIGPGKTVRGAITADNAVKTYSLQGASGQMIVARMRRLSGDLAVFLYVVAIDNGQTIAQAAGDNGVAELSVVLPANGMYAVVATREGKQTGTTTGDYSLTVSPPGQSAPIPPAFQGYAPLQYGDKVSGTIDDKTYAIPYVFAGEAGDAIEATMSAASDSHLDSYLILQNANGDAIAEDDNGGGAQNARLRATLPIGGYYALIATRARFAQGTTTGHFDLQLAVLDPSQASGKAGEGMPLVAGQAQTGQVGQQVGTLFHFEAQANTAVSVDVNPAAGLDVVTILADSGFHQVATAVSGPIRSTLLPRAGTYYIFVLRQGGPNDPSIGAYALTLQGVVNPAPTAAPSLLALGQPVTGTITQDAYQVRYMVQARAGTALLVTMEAAPGSSLDPMVALLDDGNNLLLVNDNASKSTRNAALIYDVSKDGTYTILATRAQEAAGTTTGAYILKVEARQPTTPTPPPTGAPPQVVPISYGGTASDAISAQRYLYYYTFQGHAGDVISIRLSHVPGSTLDPLLYLYLYSPQPKLLAANNDLTPGNVDAAIVKFKLPQSGPYLIVATRMGAAQGKTEGNFILTLNRDE